MAAPARSQTRCCGVVSVTRLSALDEVASTDLITIYSAADPRHGRRFQEPRVGPASAHE